MACRSLTKCICFKLRRLNKNFIMNHTVHILIRYDMQITGVVSLLVGFSVILFEVFPEESVWSIPVTQADEHVIAVPGSGGFNLLLTQRQEAYKTLTKEQQRFWKRILIVDDNTDITKSFKEAIEDSNNNIEVNKRIEVYTSNNPVVTLSEFKPNFYDLLLVDINMPHMNGFELCEKILAIDINVRVCFMSSGEINRKALREIYPAISVGCFIRKPVTTDYLLKRIRLELD
jgi:CheY-like chemotaxis protein